jgi:hypothetical protein
MRLVMLMALLIGVVVPMAIVLLLRAGAGVPPAADQGGPNGNEQA